MQDSKNINSPKNINVKSTFGSPPNKIKATTSPRHIVANNKSPVGAVSPKVGQWKTDRNSNMNNYEKKETRKNPEQNMKDHGNEKKVELQPQKTKMGSPRNAPRVSHRATAPRNQEVQQQKSAVIKSCENCKTNESKNQQKIKELEQTISELQSSQKESKLEIESLRKEKKELEDKVSKFSNVLSENRKLIKEKAMKFNNDGEEIIKMNERILELEETIQKMTSQRLVMQQQLSAKLQQQERGSGGQVPEIQLMKKFTMGQINSLKQTFDQQYDDLNEQITRQDKIIDQLNQKAVTLSSKKYKKEIQLMKTIKLLKEQNEELKLMSRNNLNKQSVNTSVTNMSSNRDFQIASDTIVGSIKAKNSHNRSLLISKLDRIKKISERQNQIINQIKESSKSEIYEEISASKSSLLVE